MKALSITAAWEATHRFVAREVGLLAPVSLAFVGLPSIAMDLSRPAAAVAGKPVEGGPWMLVAVVALVAVLFGGLALTTLALRPGLSVRDALAHAARRLWPTLVASLLVGMGAALAMLPLVAMLPAGATPGTPPNLSPSVAMLLLLYLAAALAAAVLVSVRFLLTSAVIAAEPLGPIAALKRCWHLTRGCFWRLLGFFLMFLAASFLISIALGMALGAVFLLIGKALGDAQIGALLGAVTGGVISAALSTYFSVMLAMLYRQLAVSSSGT